MTSNLPILDQKALRLTAELSQQFAGSGKLEKAIRKHLKGLGYVI